jgi:hypothetical protein
MNGCLDRSPNSLSLAFDFNKSSSHAFPILFARAVISARAVNSDINLADSAENS